MGRAAGWLRAANRPSAAPRPPLPHLQSPMESRLSPTTGIIASALCRTIGGVAITVGATVNGWFVAGGVVILALAVWGLAVSVVKAGAYQIAPLMRFLPRGVRGGK